MSNLRIYIFDKPKQNDYNTMHIKGKINMSKNIKTDLMLQLPAGKALPKPPLSTVIGPSGISLNKL